MTPLMLQIWGFSLLIVAAAALGGGAAANASTVVMFLLFCFLLFALNWGPNVSTYTLPVEVFPTEVRSTCFGVCAAAGKLGALVGSSSFEGITNGIGARMRAVGMRQQSSTDAAQSAPHGSLSRPPRASPSHA